MFLRSLFTDLGTKKNLNYILLLVEFFYILPFTNRFTIVLMFYKWEKVIRKRSAKVYRKRFVHQ